MSEISGGSILDMLDDLEAPAMEVWNRGVRLSTITAKLKGSVDVRLLLGKFQQLPYNPDQSVQRV